MRGFGVAARGEGTAGGGVAVLVAARVGVYGTTTTTPSNTAATTSDETGDAEASTLVEVAIGLRLKCGEKNISIRYS